MNERQEVTLKDVYEIVNNIDCKIDKQICDLDKRVKEIELWRASVVGSFVIIAGIFSLLFTLVSDWIKSKISQ